MEGNFDKHKESAEANFRGVNAWLANQFLSDYERNALAERFSELLLRYKELINAVCDDSANGGNGTTAKLDGLKAWAESLPGFIRK